MTKDEDKYYKFLKVQSIMYLALLLTVGIGLIIVNGIIIKRLMIIKKIDENSEDMKTLKTMGVIFTCSYIVRGIF